MREAKLLQPFIPSWLDDMALTAIQFRIFCHLSRRAGQDGKCYPSGPSIAKACRVNKDTVWPAIAELERVGLIIRGKHFRNSNYYIVSISRPEPIGGHKGAIEVGRSTEGSVLQSAEFEGLQSAESGGRQSAESKGCKGNPMKEIQQRESRIASNSAPVGTTFTGSISRRLTLHEAETIALQLHEKARYNSEAVLGPFQPEEILQWTKSWFLKVEADGGKYDGRKIQNPRANLEAWLRSCAEQQSKRFKELWLNNGIDQEPPF